jgi:hypothetical protein
MVLAKKKRELYADFKHIDVSLTNIPKVKNENHF